MRSIGIRELKQNASAVVRDVKAGESVVITDRGTPVARLNPISTVEYTPYLDELIARGEATPPRNGPPYDLSTISRVELDLPTQEIIDDIRGPW